MIAVVGVVVVWERLKDVDDDDDGKNEEWSSDKFGLIFNLFEQTAVRLTGKFVVAVFLINDEVVFVVVVLDLKEVRGWAWISFVVVVEKNKEDDWGAISFEFGFETDDEIDFDAIWWVWFAVESINIGCESVFVLFDSVFLSLKSKIMNENLNLRLGFIGMRPCELIQGALNSLRTTERL